MKTSSSFKEGKIKASGTMICPQHWLKNTQSGNCLAVQWWGLHTSTTGGVSSIPGWGRKILHAVQCGQKMIKVKN